MISCMFQYKRLLLMFLITGLIPMVIFTYVAYSIAASSVRKDFQRQNYSFLTITQHHLTTYFQEREHDAQHLASSGDVFNALLVADNRKDEPMTWEKSYSQLDSTLSAATKYYEYSNIFLTDILGTVVYSSNDKVYWEGANFSYKHFIKEALAGKLTWSEIFYWDILNENLLVISAPVYKNGNSTEMIGTINLVFNQQKVDNIVHAGLDKMVDSADSYMINGNSILLTNTRFGDYQKDAALKKKIETPAMLELAAAVTQNDLKYRETYEYNDYLGNRVVGSVGVIRIGQVTCGLVVESNESDIFKQIRGLLYLIPISACILALFGLLIAHIFAVSLSRNPYCNNPSPCGDTKKIINLTERFKKAK